MKLNFEINLQERRHAVVRTRFLDDRRPSTRMEHDDIAAESPTALDPEATQHQQRARSELTSSARHQRPIPHWCPWGAVLCLQDFVASTPARVSLHSAMCFS